MKALSILSELAKHPEGSFLDLLQFNESSIGACSITGTSPVWEMHPDTDEFFHVLEGYLEITVLEDTGPNLYKIEAGSIFVIPKTLWHKPAAPEGAKFIYFTPGTSLHSDLDDPRTA